MKCCVCCGGDDHDEQLSSSSSPSSYGCFDKIRRIACSLATLSVLLTTAVALSLFSILDCQFLTVVVGFEPSNADIGEDGVWRDGEEGDSVSVGLWSLCSKMEDGRCHYVLDPYHTLGFTEKIGRWGALEKLTNVGTDDGGGLMVAGDSMWGISRIIASVAAFVGLVSACVAWIAASKIVKPNPKIVSLLSTIAFSLEAATMILFFQIEMCAAPIWLDETKASTLGRFLRRAQSCEISRGLILSLSSLGLYLIAILISCQKRREIEETTPSSPEYSVLGSVYADEETGMCRNKDNKSESHKSKASHASTNTTESVSSDVAHRAQNQYGRYPSRAPVDGNKIRGAQLSFIEETSERYERSSKSSRGTDAVMYQDIGHPHTSRTRIMKLETEGKENSSTHERPRFVPTKCGENDDEPPCNVGHNVQFLSAVNSLNSVFDSNQQLENKGQQENGGIHKSRSMDHLDKVSVSTDKLTKVSKSSDEELRKVSYHRSRSMDNSTQFSKRSGEGSTRSRSHRSRSMDNSTQFSKSGASDRHSLAGASHQTPPPVSRQFFDPLSKSQTALEKYGNQNQQTDPTEHALVLVSNPKSTQTFNSLSNPPVNDNNKETYIKQQSELLECALVPVCPPKPKQEHNPVFADKKPLDDPSSFRKVNDDQENRSHHQLETMERALVLVSTPKQTGNFNLAQTESSHPGPKQTDTSNHAAKEPNAPDQAPQNTGSPNLTPDDQINNNMSNYTQQQSKLLGCALVPISATPTTHTSNLVLSGQTHLDDPKTFKKVNDDKGGRRLERTDSKKRAYDSASAPDSTPASDLITDGKDAQVQPSQSNDQLEHRTQKRFKSIDNESTLKSIPAPATTQNSNRIHIAQNPSTKLTQNEITREDRSKSNQQMKPQNRMRSQSLSQSVDNRPHVPAPSQDNSKQQGNAHKQMESQDRSRSKSRSHSSRPRSLSRSRSQSIDRRPRHRSSSIGHVPASSQDTSNQHDGASQLRKPRRKSLSMDHVAPSPNISNQQDSTTKQRQSRPRRRSIDHVSAPSQVTSRPQDGSNQTRNPQQRRRSMDHAQEPSQQTLHQDSANQQAHPQHRRRSMDHVPAPSQGLSTRSSAGQQKNTQHRRRSMDHVQAPSKVMSHQRESGHQQIQPQHRRQSIDHVPTPSQGVTYQQHDGIQQRQPRRRSQSMDHLIPSENMLYQQEVPSRRQPMDLIPAPSQDLSYQQDRCYATQQRLSQHRRRSADHVSPPFQDTSYQQNIANHHRSRSMEHVSQNNSSAMQTRDDHEWHSQQGMEQSSNLQFQSATQHNASGLRNENESFRHPPQDQTYRDQSSKGVPTDQQIKRPKQRILRPRPPPVILGKRTPKEKRKEVTNQSVLPHTNQQNQMAKKPIVPKSRNIRSHDTNIDTSNQNAIRSKAKTNRIRNHAVDEEPDPNFLFNSPLGKGRNTIEAKDWDDVSSLGTVEEVGVPKSRKKMK